MCLVRRVKKGVIRKLIANGEPFTICGCNMSVDNGWHITAELIERFKTKVKEVQGENIPSDEVFITFVINAIVDNWRIKQGSRDNGYTPHYYVEEDKIII